MVRGTLDVVLMGVLALGLAALMGCQGIHTGGALLGGNTPTGALASGGAVNVYAIEYGTGGTGASVVAFSADTSGSLSPTATLVMPATMAASALATDSSGAIYVGGYSTTTGTAQILVFAAGATGTATPTRTITVDPNLGIAIATMTVDASGKIYTAGANESGMVAVFAAGANGMSTPTTLLDGAALEAPLGIAVDGSGRIYVSNNGSSGGQILVFAAGANGSDAPVQTISTATDTATARSIFYGLAIDESGNLFVVHDSATFDSSGDETGASAAIEEYAAGQTGEATPIQSITGASTELTTGGGLRVDGVGNLYVITGASVNNTAVYTLLGFGPKAAGNVAPGVTISSSELSRALSEIAVH